MTPFRSGWGALQGHATERFNGHDQGTTLLAVATRAPSWMEITSVDVIANGAVEQSFVVDPGSATPPVWFSATLPVNPSVDTWYIVRTDGGSLFPVVPGADAFAVTNPLYLDLAGDGFDAPGL
jgi:hypothetical protein